MTRRSFLAASAALAASTPRSRMGVAIPSFMSTRRFGSDTLAYLEHCASLGAAGIQGSITSHEPDYLARVERRAKELGMYIEVTSGLPRAEMSDFVRTVESAKRVGAVCIRSACLSQRRYERFSSLAEWNEFVRESKAGIARAVPVAEKYRIPFAIENHKDWTIDEMVELMKRYSSEYFGACLDTGNNISLLDDPMEVVERLAPYAHSTHIKDMGLGEHRDGFLLSEVRFGTGILDIRKIVSIIERARPRTRLSIEMISRNPLVVPCFTDKYWVTFPGRNGRYLARTMRLVHEKKSKLPVIDGLDAAALAQLEDENVRRSLAFPL